MIDDYFRQLINLLESSRIVKSHEVTFDKRERDAGYVRGDIFFADGSRLHFREFINAEFVVERISYTYHYQRAEGTFVFRYDDSEHYPDLPNFPHHKHMDDESHVLSVIPPDLSSVLKEIESLIVVE